jgi:hypothetical protein
VRALGAIEFFKTRQYDNVVRSLRETFFRAGLDQREAKLFRAMSIEVVHFLRRMGVALPEVGPPGSPPRLPTSASLEDENETAAGAPGRSRETLS